MKRWKRSPAKSPKRHKRLFIRVQDGLFSIEGLGEWHSYWREPYHLMLTVPWLGFVAIIAVIFLLLNTFFASLYLLGGDCIVNARPGSFEDAFHFSVQTLASIGYGVMSPKTSYAHLVVVCQSIVGLFVIAVLTGLIFSRFTRPTARVLFSKAAVVMPFEGLPTLVFRTANQRRNRILEAEVIVYLSMDQVTQEGHQMRRFYQLKLSRSRTPTFNLPWTLMHTIDSSSPLYGLDRQQMIEAHTQITVSLNGLDETVSQNVHARHIYGMSQIFFDHQLADIIHYTEDGHRYVDFEYFDQVIPLT
ncbi:MAG: ion channel [Pseudanabaenaceae cyanobacterium bins.68]|nr:ion channel [Pseudanabaenaceae cyanobacterium bins.68]